MAEYALLRLRRAVVSPLPSTAVGSLPPAVNLFNGSSAAMDKLAPGSVALARLDSRLRQLGSSLFEGSEPALDSPEFAAAVAELAQSDIQRLQASLTRSAQQVRIATCFECGVMCSYVCIPACQFCLLARLLLFVHG